MESHAKAAVAEKAAFEYGRSRGRPTVLTVFSIHGTLWVKLIFQPEFYVYPLVHTALALFNYQHKSTHGVNFWQWGGADDFFMVPVEVLTLVTSLMVFFLVFFLSQCAPYSNRSRCSFLTDAPSA